MPFLNPNLGIDFSNYIADRTLNFTGREWVFEAIQNWLVDPNSDRIFLLTGEPGSGKTAIAARLAQFAEGAATYPGLEAGFLQAVHFCSARDSVWIDPKEFARSLALQLAASIPEFALALKDIGEKTININVDLTVGTAQNSDIKGVVIQNLTLSGLTGQEAFTQVVVNPLRQIQQEGFSQPVTILVDSLDEALTHDGESTIVSLVSKLSANVKLRLILTSRNEGRVKEKLEEYEELFLSASENLDKNQQDVRAYINAKFRQEKPPQNSLQAEALDQEVLTTNLIEKSEGNFLYVRFLLEAVALGQQSFANLDGLPQGLDELYYSSLGRVVELGKKDWSEVYAPVMGVLLAAQESLTESQIRAFTKLKESVVWDCLTDLQQFLDEIESEDEETLYKLYHQSVTDFLGKRQLVIRKKKLNNRYFLSGQEQHQRLLAYYRPEDKTWHEVQLEKIDRYGLRHLASHLLKTNQKSELYSLLTDSPQWMNIKSRQCFGEFTYISDLELAINSFPDSIETSQISTLIKLHTAKRVADKQVEKYSNTDLEVLTWLEHNNEALNYARLRTHVDSRFNGLLAILRALKGKRQFDPALGMEAYEVAMLIVDKSSRTKALDQLVAVLSQAGQFTFAEEVAKSIEEHWQRTDPLRKLSQALTWMKQFSEAERIAMSVHNDEALSFLVTALMQERQFSEAERVATRISNSDSQKEVFIKLIQALAKTECFSEAEQIAKVMNDASGLLTLASVLIETKYFLDAERIITDISDPLNRAGALIQLVKALAESKKLVQVKKFFTGEFLAEVERLAIPEEVDFLSKDNSSLLIQLVEVLAQIGEQSKANQLQSKVDRLKSIFNPINSALSGIDLSGIDIFSGMGGVYTLSPGEKSYYASLAALTLGESLLQEGRFTDAGRMIQDLELEQVEELINPLVQSQKFNALEQLASSVEDLWSKATILSYLARALAQAGCDLESNEIFKRAKQAISLIVEDEYKQNSHRFSQFALLLVLAGEQQQADEVFRRTKQIAKLDDKVIPEKLLNQLVVTLINVKQPLQAMSLIHYIEDIGLLAQLALALTWENYQLQADSVFSKFNQIVEQKDQVEQVKIFNQIMTILASARPQRQLPEFLNQVQETFYSMQDDMRIMRALVQLTTTLAQVDCQQQAIQVSILAKQLFERIVKAEYPIYYIGDILPQLAVGLYQAACQQQTNETFIEADQIAHSLDDDRTKAKALCHLGVALTQAGRHSKASDILIEAERAASSITEDYYHKEAFYELVDSLIQVGQFYEAERLAQALPYQNDWATKKRFEDLAIALAKVGSFDEAERIIRSSSISESGVVLARLAQILAQAEHHSQSEKLFIEAEKLIFSTKDVRSMVELALALAQAGYTSQVDKIIDEAERVLKSTSYEFPLSLQYEELALALIKSGNFSKAERVAVLFGTASPIWELVRVSVNFIEIGQIKKAFAVLVGLQSLDDYWDAITSWIPALKKIESDLPAMVLRDAASIIGWEKPEFQKIYELLSPKSDKNG